MISYNAAISAPIGHIAFSLEENQLVGIQLLPTDFPLLILQDPLTQTIAEQLQKYFQNPQIKFTFPCEHKVVCKRSRPYIEFK